MEISKNIVDNQVGEETVLLNLKSGRYFVLNEVASLVWTGIKNSKNADEISYSIAKTFDVDVTTAKKDLNDLLKEMRKSEILSA